MLDRGRILGRKEEIELPDMQRVVVAVDPSGCSGPEDLRSDEVGIIVAGLGEDGRGYILEDLSGRHGPGKWKEIVASAYEPPCCRCGRCRNQLRRGHGVQEVVRTAATSTGVPIAFREVKASRGKVVRAEPIAVLFSQGKVSLVGRFEDLEYQLCAMTTGGYMWRPVTRQGRRHDLGIDRRFSCHGKRSRPRRKEAAAEGSSWLCKF